jgi:hypothetical protein
MLKILVIICSHEFNSSHCENIQILKDYLLELPDTLISYCGISNQDDFHIFEDIISFDFKVINPKYQLSKIRDFIADNKSTLNYDWYIKIRPDVKLLEPIQFENLLDNSINARARVYHGPKRIKYGMSINGEGGWKNVGDCFYDINEIQVVLDDQIFIFHHNVINAGTFNKIIKIDGPEHEWIHTKYWEFNNIHLNVIGINLLMTKYMCYSGDVN